MISYVLITGIYIISRVSWRRDIAVCRNVPSDTRPGNSYHPVTSDKGEDLPGRQIGGVVLLTGQDDVNENGALLHLRHGRVIHELDEFDICKMEGNLREEEKLMKS